MSLSFEPLEPEIGARVSGVDLSQPLTPAEAAQIESAMDAYASAHPELAAELDHVVNSFDPWARDRGEYYTLDWKPRAGAEGDEAFRSP